MLDMHVHLEQGPYTKEWLLEFVKYAQERNISKLCLLEHSHRFIEFLNIYDSISLNTDYRNYQMDWLSRKSGLELSEYKQFINEMKKIVLLSLLIVPAILLASGAPEGEVTRYFEQTGRESDYWQRVVNFTIFGGGKPRAYSFLV